MVPVGIVLFFKHMLTGFEMKPKPGSEFQIYNATPADNNKGLIIHYAHGCGDTQMNTMIDA